MASLVRDRGPVGDSVMLHFGHSRVEVPQEEKNGSYINHEITWFGTSPISVLGVVLNALVLLIWNQKERHQPIVFLFKVLAVCDISYLFFFNMWWYTPPEAKFVVVASGGTFTAQYMVINVTLLIGVWRWVAVFRTDQSRTLLTKRRSRIAVIIIASYCIILNATEHAIVYSWRGDETVKVVSFIMSNLLLSLPLLLLAIFMISLMWMLWHRPKVLPELSSTGHVHFHSHSFNTSAKIRRLTYTVFCITISTFIAYPVTGAITVYFRLTDDPDLKDAKYVAFGVTNLVYAIHSSIPFFFYFCFMLKFRKMCMLKFITAYTGTYSTRIASEMEGHSDIRPDLSEVTAPQHHRSSYRHSLVVVNEDGTLTVSKAPRPSVSLREEKRGSVSPKEEKRGSFSSPRPTSSPILSAVNQPKDSP